MLTEQLRAADELPRKRAVRELAGLEDVQAIPGLIFALGDRDWEVPKVAVQGLTSIGKPAVPDLIKALKHEECGVRQEAAGALGRIGDVRAVSALVEALDDLACVEAAEALHNILCFCKSVQEVDEFKRGLEEGIERLGEKAKVEAIARWRKTDAITVLKSDIEVKKGLVDAQMSGVQSQGTVLKPRRDPKGKAAVGQQLKR